MSDKHLSYLSQVYDRLKEIEQESVLKLGRARAFHFVELANDWIDIQSAISRTYSYNERGSCLQDDGRNRLAGHGQL
jgi:hypothetical protein